MSGASPQAVSAPVARFDDLRAGTSLVFGSVREHLLAHTPAEVLPVLRAAQAASEAGRWVVGVVTYEAAAGLDPDARVHDPVPGLPLVHLMVCEAPDAEPVPLEEQRLGTWHAGPWRADLTPAEHAERVARVHAAIAAGDTYQANLTTHLRTRIDGDLRPAYRDLARRQQGAFCAHLDLGRWQVLSASPECFVRYADGTISAVPMKGTAPRGPDPEADRAAREALRRSAKDHAENVMITDLLRNDLSIVAATGTVEVPALLTVEEYPTLWQLTSTVRARLRADVGLPEILRALFPCGSITGAPKLSSMALLRELEASPRGVYCGAIGYLAPGGRTGSFSVAIRTVLVDTRSGDTSYGVGGGVTWASTARGEYEELLVKARVLGELEPAAVGLLETLAVDGGEPRHLRAHVERLRASAQELGIPMDPEAVTAAIRAEAAAVASRGAEPPGAITERATADDGVPRQDAAPGADEERLVRACLHPDGRLEVTSRPAGTPAVPARLAIDDVPVDPGAPAVRLKTTDRRHYEQARGRHPAADDVVLLGRDGHVTETSIASLAVLLDGTWWTPPVADGCLPGVGRALALAGGRLRERSITVAELRAAEAVAVVSSARGWRSAVIVDPAIEVAAEAAVEAPSAGDRRPTDGDGHDGAPSRRASSTARSTRSASSGPSTR
ncbi:aminodeoxychorismate synthase component I [Brachybacterium sp. AOP25-B2-12]|uniref:aminodeoxychorismate synthase component I n=1 Tax=Brachybacterium sp. AOP25-B2-12 TaxID=3457710 RepID=UPI004034CEE7